MTTWYDPVTGQKIVDGHAAILPEGQDPDNSSTFNPQKTDVNGASYVSDTIARTQVIPQIADGTPTPEVYSLEQTSAIAVVITINHGDTVEAAARLTNKYPQVFRCPIGETIKIGPLSTDATKIYFDTMTADGTLGGNAVELFFNTAGVREILFYAPALVSDITAVRVEGYA